MSRKAIVTPTVSAAQERMMPGTMPNSMTFAVEKMIAGGNPRALTKSVRKNAKTAAQSP